MAMPLGQHPPLRPLLSNFLYDDDDMYSSSCHRGHRDCLSTFFSLSSFTSFTPREGLHFSFFFFIVFTASLFLFKFDVSHIIRNFAHKISHVTHRYDFDDSSLDLNLGSWILTLCTRGPQYHSGCRARDINTLVNLFVT